MNVLMASPEAAPYAKTGGLADVAGALAGLMQKTGQKALLMLPYYREIKNRIRAERLDKTVEVKVGTGVFRGGLHSHRHAVFIECDEFFDREELYGTAAGDYPDNAQRFIFFSRAVLEAAKALDFRPDVVHAHDWQTALIPLYLKTAYGKDVFFRDARSVFTIHNLGYQGLFPPEVMSFTGLGMEQFSPEGVEFFGKMNFLKAGIIGADAITTVSPTYAKEILTPEHGFGLDGLLRKRAAVLTGIINGVDYSEWNPAKDTLIPANYTSGNIEGKKTCRKHLAATCGFADSRAPVAAFVGRLTSQKGVDILAGAARDLMDWGVNLVVLGKGDEEYRKALSALAGRHKGRLHAHIGFDEELSHLVYAGSDMFIMPSRYEPCGLGQMIAMRYGTPPVATNTGGLADTIRDYSPLRGAGTGFLFEDRTADALRQCVRGALIAHADRARWRAVVKASMRADFSWKNSAGKYVGLYGSLKGMGG
jgi:starch synthase